MKHKNAKRYDDVLKIRKSIIIFILCVLLSSIYTSIQNQEYEKKNNQMQRSENYVGIIESNPVAKEYSTQYLLRVKKVEKESSNILVYIRVKGKNNLEYGDEISFIGEYDQPDGARNDKGFDYKQYLKSNRNCWSCNNYTSGGNR